MFLSKLYGLFIFNVMFVLNFLKIQYFSRVLHVYVDIFENFEKHNPSHIIFMKFHKIYYCCLLGH